MRQLAKGQQFDAPTMGVLITVNRVSKDGEWADILCESQFHRWTKRQPLVDGWFSFPVAPRDGGAE